MSLLMKVGIATEDAQMARFITILVILLLRDDNECPAGAHYEQLLLVLFPFQPCLSRTQETTKLLASSATQESRFSFHNVCKLFITIKCAFKIANRCFHGPGSCLIVALFVCFIE